MNELSWRRTEPYAVARRAVARTIFGGTPFGGAPYYLRCLTCPIQRREGDEEEEEEEEEAELDCAAGTLGGIPYWAAKRARGLEAGRAKGGEGEWRLKLFYLCTLNER